MGVLGGGFLSRQLARQMVGLIPVWGIVPKVAVAYAGTWAIGRAVQLWATEGRKITPELMRGNYREALAQGRQAAQRIVDNARRPRLPSGAPKAPNPKLSASSRLLRRVRKSLPACPRVRLKWTRSPFDCCPISSVFWPPTFDNRAWQWYSFPHMSWFPDGGVV